MLRRTDKNPLADWWWTVDRLLIALVLTLMFTGLVLSFAASPAIAARLDLQNFHFVIRQAVFIVAAVAIMISTSLLKAERLRRIALVMLGVMLALTALTLVAGMEVKGARRWLYIAGFSLQPSEFLKPAFIVVTAWFFAEGVRRPEMPGTLIACGLLLPVTGLLLLQPDFGQTMLVTITWGALFFMAGMSWIWIVIFGGLGLGGIVGAYFTVPHIQKRIDGFLNPETTDTYQTDRAVESFLSGGWFGKGPGEGTVKHGLPDSHTDFIFAVAGEEFGAVFCILVVTVYAALVVRGLAQAYRDEDLFRRLATAGLCILVGLQATINMAVNLSLMPAKGMTLPFISYGGSSMISMGFALGMVLSLTRRRPQAIALRSAPRQSLLVEDPAE